jgi:hypothetical protein
MQPHYLLGLLNSRLLSYQLRTVCPAKLSGYIRFSSSYLTSAPIPDRGACGSSENGIYKHIVELVHRMLSLHTQLRSTKTGHDKTLLQRQIAATDREIDRLVYELYGLTDEEIKIVEEATQ